MLANYGSKQASEQARKGLREIRIRIRIRGCVRPMVAQRSVWLAGWLAIGARGGWRRNVEAEFFFGDSELHQTKGQPHSMHSLLLRLRNGDQVAEEPLFQSRSRL